MRPMCKSQITARNERKDLILWKTMICMVIPNLFWLAQCMQHSVIISSNFYQTLQCVCKHPVDPRFSLIRTKFGLWCAGTCRSILPVITSRDDTMWEHSDRIFGRHNRGLWPFYLSEWRTMKRLHGNFERMPKMSGKHASTNSGRHHHHSLRRSYGIRKFCGSRNIVHGPLSRSYSVYSSMISV